ncbi:thiamine biosynthesis protein X [Corynebacterium tuberculostearicum]|uniref:Thiamine biosynthesis protein X n=1 Tax=Corynebacterium tuberculostearicum TaxID=38304 RepID=A0AAE4NKD5_9CORY|nr:MULTISPECIES: thiamine biosynthesis protein X [Corynebacterium]MCT1427607.1 thiamine biosynthesis protein X [Corynebacterium sp. p3-SID1241]MDV2418409.1 thiamine biosynthesis protein X [Corynebacterium tuberculostearicum]MDV2431793.1 thiamine biosynthesis protein X [Corynebacterium tuberculostearicum]WKE59793.1 thiamine biosynthesis protein X [Corynebacterium tuberculostearicum]
MKKFSRYAAAGLVFTAGLSLAACHPPNQQDSDSKVENASTFTGEAPMQKDAETSSSAPNPAVEEAPVVESGAPEEPVQPNLNGTATELPQQ